MQAIAGWTATAELADAGKGFRFGSAFGVFREGDYFFVDASTRDLAQFQISDIEQKLNATAMVGFHNVYNVLDSSGKANVQQSTLWGLAAELRTPFYQGRSVFSRLGAIHLSGLSEDAFKNRTATGISLAIGADLAIQESRKDDLFGKSIPSIFFLFGGQFGFPRASKTAADLELLNGLSLAVGLHNHF